MKRISSNMSNYDMQYHLRNREWKMNEVQNRMATQSRIKNLRDDPVAAAHSVRYQSHIERMNRYSLNIDSVTSSHRETEAYMTSANNILHRIREIGIQGANDTYTTEEKKMMADEVNQLLTELVEIANAKSADGTSIFAGDRTLGQSFRVLKGNAPGSDERVITQVDYLGTVNRNLAEISEGSYIEKDFPGNQVFWAEQQQIFSNRNAENFTLLEDAAIRIDGEDINLKAGDNVNAVMAKINDSHAAVRASLDPVRNSLVIETTSPHQIMIEDAGSGTVLRDLGIVSGNGRPPQNLAKDARVSGGSVFDMVMSIRDQLYQGNALDLGGAGIKGLTLAQNNLISEIAGLGARDSRMQEVKERLLTDIPVIQEKNSRLVDLDFAEAITDLKMLEYNHKAALQTAGRILQPSLLDFLR